MLVINKYLNHPRLQHIIHSICCSRVLFFIFRSQRLVDSLNMGSSSPSVSTTSIYFTSILPPPSTVQTEEIQMKDTSRVERNGGVEVVYSGHDNIRYGELLINGVDSLK